MEDIPKKYEKAYRLLRQLESLIEAIFALKQTTQQLSYVRYKPLFQRYITCFEEFKKAYPKELKTLQLEDVELFDDKGKEQFTTNKLSTILHQAQWMVGMLKGFLPPKLVENPGGTTIIVSSQAMAQSTAEATANVQFTLVLEGMADAITKSKLKKSDKDEILKEIEELKNSPAPSESRIKSLAKKLGGKFQEMGENVLAKVIADLLKSQMGIPPIT